LVDPTAARRGRAHQPTAAEKASTRDDNCDNALGMSLRLPLRVQKVGPVDVPLPAYQSAKAAGLDLCAALAEPKRIEPGARVLVPTGLALAIPDGYEGQVRPRSGLALKHGIGIVNSPGTIDADYRGMVQVLLINHGQEPYLVEPMSRIAQLVICPVMQAELTLVTELDETGRGAGGYGSTGV
jgi:dUTP pyrophosphatase